MRPGVAAVRAAAVYAAICLSVGCALNPVSGVPEVVVVTTAQEMELGKEEAAKVQREIGLVETHAVAEYVRAVGERLAERAPRRDVTYTFHVVDMVEPNAFALPGGYVYVSRGLLTFANSEDELANVIGHEIGHVAARHAVQRLTRAAPLAIATGLPALAAGIVSPALGRTVAGIGGLASTALLAPHSRAQEYEADDIGQRMAAGAGWDPAGMPSFLHTLAREKALEGGADVPAFLRSHPSTPKRVERARQRAGGLTPAPGAGVAGDHAAFLRRLDGLAVGDDPTNGVFDGQRFLHPALDFSVTFPDGWKTRDAPQFVGAEAAGGGAVAVLELQEEGSDPLEAAQRFARAQRIVFDEGPDAVEIGTLPGATGAAVLRTARGELVLDLTWIAHQGRIFRATGATATGRAAGFRPLLRDIATSFRPLTDAERLGIQVIRLRIVEARAGETVAELVARTKAVASAETTAVANGISAEAALQAGQLMKVAVWELYAHPR